MWIRSGAYGSQISAPAQDDKVTASSLIHAHNVDSLSDQRIFFLKNIHLLSWFQAIGEIFLLPRSLVCTLTSGARDLHPSSVVVPLCPLALLTMALTPLCELQLTLDILHCDFGHNT